MLRYLKPRISKGIQASNIPRSERISVVLPVLNEAARICDCLDGLVAQPEEIAEVLVVDGGSTDGTRSIVERYHMRDERVRFIDASPVDEHWTGKAWGLYIGLKNSDPQSEWILCLDADVRCSPMLARSLLHHAERTGVSTFSVATIQRLSGHVDALIHPPMLTTLIYRFGSPGKATKSRHRVQANGQCFLSRRKTLLRTDAFRTAQMSLCEDITIVRRLAECGETIGFYESENLIEVRMYDNWRETWRNWPRSLPMRDQYFGWREAAGLLKVLFLQALPLPAWLISLATGAPLWIVAALSILLLFRLGILVGVARAYKPRPWTYWLSPLLDLPVALRLISSALMRRHVWRGRTYVRRKGGLFEPVSVSQPAPR